jgi:hypothetical protein
LQWKARSGQAFLRAGGLATESRKEPWEEPGMIALLNIFIFLCLKEAKRLLNVCSATGIVLCFVNSQKI